MPGHAREQLGQLAKRAILQHGALFLLMSQLVFGGKKNLAKNFAEVLLLFSRMQKAWKEEEEGAPAKAFGGTGFAAKEQSFEEWVSTDINWPSIGFLNLPENYSRVFLRWWLITAMSCGSICHSTYIYNEISSFSKSIKKSSLFFALRMGSACIPHSGWRGAYLAHRSCSSLSLSAIISQ